MLINEPEARRGWRREWFEAISNISDLELQKKMWLDKNNKNPVWSYVEFAETYFDRLNNTDYNELVSVGYLTRDESRSVQQFHDAIEAYEPPGRDNWDLKRILKDPAWLHVVECAQNAIDRLRQLDPCLGA